jgi:hypothetical protein
VLFANLLPGSTFRGAAVFRQPFANGAIANFTINGGQPAQNEFLVDGAPNNSRAANLANNIAYIPVAEAVREVTILSNAYDASYGKTTGGIINVVMRGGTSQHHLTGWGFLQRRPFNAFDRFNVFSVRYNSNPFDPNFGTYFPAEANAFSGQQRDSQPRSVQLGFKLMW